MTIRQMLSINLELPPGKMTERSRHYKAYVGQTFPGVVTMFGDAPQETRTTVHHVVKRGVGKKGPDWWAIPVSEKRHVHGKRSIDKLGKSGFRKEWSLPAYEIMALIFLCRYLRSGACENVITGDGKTIEPRPIDKRSAAGYFDLLQTLINDGKRAKSWNWAPPERTEELR